MAEPNDFSPDDYVPPYPAAELDAAEYAPLSAVPVSREAVSACAELAERVLADVGEKVTNIRREALGALMADLVGRDEGDSGGWLYRSMGPKSFTGQAVGYKPFNTIYSAMLKAALVQQHRGNRVWMASEIAASGRSPAWQRATRFRSTARLREWLSERDITRAKWSSHFERATAAAPRPDSFMPVVLRAEKPPRRMGRFRGRDIPITRSTPKVGELSARMDRINAYLAGAVVDPFGPVVLRRIFACGDDARHGWNQGGRLYAIGSEPYQTAKREKRRNITINGQPTTELDIQASHLTILAALGQVPRFSGDPYEIDGFPRPVVKQWVNMTLSHGKRHPSWPQEAVEGFSKHGIDLKAEYPIKSTGDAILRHLPILQEDGSAVAVGWGELQFRESEVVLATMEALAFEHNVPALPVHDSLIVPVGARDLATAALMDEWHRAFNITPVIG